MAGGYYSYNKDFCHSYDFIAFYITCSVCLVTVTILIAVSLLLTLAIIFLLVYLSYKSVKKDKKVFKNNR